MSRRPLPRPDHDSLPWWEGLNDEALLLQQCRSCDRYRWPPRVICNSCGSFEGAWIEASGRGTVASWTVTHHVADPDVSVPYVVMLVRCEEQDDIFIPGSYSGPSDGSGLEIGLPVVAGFDTIGGEAGARANVIKWRPADGSSA